MKRFFSPNESSPLMPYSSATIENLERPDVADDSSSLISGTVFASGRFAWLARGSSLEVISTRDGSRKAACRFGSHSGHNNEDMVISSVTECHLEDGIRLAVGLKDLSGRSGSPGMVCVFNPWVSRVVRAIEIPYAVTAVECVRPDGGADAQPTLLSSDLKLLFGILAIGTEHGHTYLVDLRSDDPVEIFDEENPSMLEYLGPNTVHLAGARDRARNNGTHLAIELGGLFHKSGKFSYISEDSSVVKVFPSASTFVTVIKYIKEATCLVVGYNFGCFHIWDLETMSLVYSSQVDQYMSAVAHFAYQEPENDPRNCTYLWVARGPMSMEDQSEMPATLTLYQMIFNSKHFLKGFGTVFRDLGGCGRRFEHQLTADAHHLADATSVGSRIICCYTLCKENSVDLSKTEESRDEEVCKGRDLTLMLCVWESPSHDQLGQPTCHLGIFDINRWYHSQMLPSIRDAMFGSKDPTCSFFAFFSLAEILNIASPDSIVDVNVIEGTLSRFSSGSDPAQEQHFWPAALRFDTCTLMETGIVRSTFLGIQRQILTDLTRQSSLGQLPDAHDYFNMCWMAGLLPRNFDLSKPQEKSFHHEALLSVALEHNLVTFVTSFIHKLGAENVTVSGMSLRLVLDWAWSNVVSSKEQLDLLCVPLFDGGGGTPDEQMLGMLEHMAVKLKNLTVIFQALLDQTAPSTQQGIKDLEAKTGVVSILSQYLQVLLCLIRFGLLPESSGDEMSGPHRGIKGYPGASLSKLYTSRRAELNSYTSGVALGGLMIDKLISELAPLWVAPDGISQFPPESLHGLCSLYLLQGVSSGIKHAIVYYLLLDMCSFNKELEIRQVAEGFAKAFCIPHGLAQLVKGFWYLDHKHFQQAVSCLVFHAGGTEIGPWQHSYIMKTLLLQGELETVLYFMKTVQPTMHTEEDRRLHLTVRIANGLVADAFNFQREHRDPADVELLLHFFHGCQQTGNLETLMQLPFNPREEECFVSFLKNGSFSSSRELLVMYFLQRGRYIEGIRLNETLKQELEGEPLDTAQKERAKVRNAIVDGYMKCLPSIQRKLILHGDKPGHRIGASRQVARPKPLSTIVHVTNKNRPVTHATIITSVMEKVAESWSPGTPQARKPTPFACTPITPKLKSILSDSNRVVLATTKKSDAPETIYEEGHKVPFGSPLFTERKRSHMYSGADALRLLSTPVVNKRASSRADSITERITVATPQSILKVTRVVRRASPRPSPSASPPLTRRSSAELVQNIADPAQELARDVEDSIATPSRRIRFAVEDTPSPQRVTSVSPQTPKVAFDTDQDMRDVSATPESGDDFVDATQTPPGPESSRDNSLKLELSPTSEDEETEVQITAAVVDLSRSHDSDMEDEDVQDEDYSSLELDNSDAVVDSDDDGPVLISPSRSGDITTKQQELQLTDSAQQRTPVKEPSPKPSSTPATRRSPSPSPKTNRSPSSPKTRQSPSPLPKTRESPSPSSKEKTSPFPSPKGRNSPSPSPKTRSSPPPSPRKSPSTSPQNTTNIGPHSLRSSDKDANTPPRGTSSPQKSKTPETSSTDSYLFAPPVVFKTTPARQQGFLETLVEGTPSGPESRTTSEEQSPSFLFSPPLTRSMKKRRSIDQLRPRDSLGRTVTPHQSPSDSPISFVTPGPSVSPRSRRRSEPHKGMKRNQPVHQMTLRSRSGPHRTARSARLPAKPH
ncbi:protein ELYS isoform X2 [Nematostella vectensis]|uniref:protein ELYS isoform X2 n=1 Tax=Nematostella vectensis TaxID=45351 RepID=UPI00138FFC73|nr:protein ELYS isoform X2 [Nematostella vectensis]